jgi:hypothetical protein
MSGCQPLRAPNHQLQICDGFISLPAYFHPQDTEAAVIVVEGDALYDVGDLLGRGSALKHGGIHVGTYFATGNWDWGASFRKPVPRRLGCREGLGAVPAFQSMLRGFGASPKGYREDRVAPRMTAF